MAVLPFSGAPYCRRPNWRKRLSVAALIAPLLLWTRGFPNSKVNVESFGNVNVDVNVDVDIDIYIYVYVGRVDDVNVDVEVKVEVKWSRFFLSPP